MSVKQDIANIYTKSSVYYLRLQYLVICYLIVLLLAAFVWPLPRAYGLNGGLRLFVGLALYVGFAVLMTYSPKFLHSSAGKYLSPDEYEEELTKNSNKCLQNIRWNWKKKFWLANKPSSKSLQHKMIVQ